MDQVFQLRIGWAAASLAAILFDILFPLALALIVRRRFGVPWRYFLYGALIFFLFQLVTRVPAVLVIQNLIQPQLVASRELTFAWVVVLSITAGLFEEGGRYIGYRWFMRREDKTWNKGVMFGLGHGGLESMLFVGGLSVLTLINLIVLSSMNLQTLPVEQRSIITQQLTQLSAQPDWTPLLGAYEHLWTIAIHVGLSVMVLQVFRRRSLWWLWLAILGHTLLDFVPTVLTSTLALPGLSRLLLPEGVVTIFGIIALWIIWKLRDREPPGALPVGAPLPQPMIEPQ